MTQSDERGFTLTEFIIVLFICAVLSAIVLPKFHLVERYTLKSQAQAIATDLQYAQRMAMNENVSYNFKIMRGSNSYLIRKSGCIIGSEKLVQLPDKIKFSNNLVNDIGYTSKGTLFNFNDGDRKGTACTIGLVSNNYTVNITVRVATGRVTVYDINKKSY